MGQTGDGRGAQQTSLHTTQRAGAKVDVLRRVRAGCGALAVAVVFCACGGGSHEAETPVEPPAAVVAKVEIVQPGAMLTPGSKATLTVRTFDAKGHAIAGADATWHASKPTVAIDANGVLTAGAAFGSALVTATVGGIASAPVMVAVAQPAAGSRPVADADIVTAPALVDVATSTGTVGSRYTVTLAGAAPSVGQPLVPTGSQPIAGRVVSTSPAAGGNALVVEVVPLLDLFDAIDIDETIPLASLTPRYGAGAPVAARTLADGRVEQDFVASIPAGTSSGRPSKHRHAKPGKGTAVREAGSPLTRSFDFGPLQCEASVATLSLDTSEVRVSIVNTVSAGVCIVKQAGQTTLVRIGTSGDLGLRAEGPIELRGEIDGKLECELEFLKLPIPVPPPVAAVAMPVVPIGVKLEAEGALKAPAITFDIKGSATRPVLLGIEVLPQVPDVRSLSSPGSDRLAFALGVEPKLPGSPDDWTLEASLEAGLYAKLAITNPVILLAHAAFDTPEELGLFELFAGEQLEAQWDSLRSQMADPASDKASRYSDQLVVSIGVSSDIPDLLRWFGVAWDAELPELTLEGPGQVSPGGVGQISLTRFQAGDDITLRAYLGDATLRHTDPFAYASTPVYNVERVEFWRLENDGTTTPLGAVTAATAAAVTGRPEPGDYSFTWRSDRADQTKDRYFAVVVPKFFSAFPLRTVATFGWYGVRETGGDNLDGYDALVVSPSGGKVYGIGHAFGDTTLDGVAYRSHGGLDVVVHEWSTEGTLLRVLYVGSSADDLAYQAKVGADGALYLAGTTVGIGTIGDQPSLGVAMTAWAAKVDLGDGTQPMQLAWARHFADARNFERGTGLALGPNGEVYLASAIGTPGYLGGDAFSFSCADVEATGNHDCGDVVLTRLDAAGNLVWRVRDAQPGGQLSTRVTAGADGSVWLNAQSYCNVHTEARSCEANETRDAGGRVLRYSSMIGIWLYDANGLGGALNTLRSDTAAQAKQSLSGPCTAWTPNGLLLGGSGNGSVDGSGVTRGTDLQLIQLDAIGQPSWSRLYGSAGDDIGAGACLLAKPDGSGWWLTFAAAALPFGDTNGDRYGGGAHDVALAELDASGTFAWGRVLGGAGDDLPYALAADGYGGLYVAGRSTGKLTSANAFAGGTDLFIAKYSQKGALLQKSSLKQPTRSAPIGPRKATLQSIAVR